MTFRGRAHKFGANIDTDAILPARYLASSDPQELARHLMEDLAPQFIQRVRPGDIIVATTNFGCGSSREHAPLAIKAVGISCVLAQSFARIFFRNAINIGLPLGETDGAGEIEDGDLLEVELLTGEVRNLSQGRVSAISPYPPFMLEILKAGGLVEYTRRRLGSR